MPVSSALSRGEDTPAAWTSPQSCAQRARARYNHHGNWMGRGWGEERTPNSEQWVLPKVQKRRHGAPETDMAAASENLDSFEKS